MDQSDLDLLQMVPAYHLQSVLKARHLSLAPLSLGGPVGNPASSLPPAVLQDLAQDLFAPTALAAVITQLDELDALILRELVACGGRSNSRDLAFYFSCTGLLEPGKKLEGGDLSDTQEPVRSSLLTAPLLPLQPPQYPPAHPHGAFEQALRRLLVFGLLFWGRQSILAGRDYTSGIHDGVLVVPDVVRAVVRQMWVLDEKPLLSLPPVEVATPLEVGEGARTFQRSLYLYWSLVAASREGLPLINNGLLARSALRQLSEQMGFAEQREAVRSESELPRLLFLRQLLQRLGLLQERRGVIRAVSSSAEEFFALPLVERAWRCYRLYLEDPFWNEIVYLPEINVRPGPLPLAPAHEEMVHSRVVVIDRLERETPEIWHDLTAFIARTRLHIPYLLFPRQYGPRAERYSSGSNPYGWDFRLRRGWLTHREGWHMVEGGFIRAVVGGPLHWLGIVELDHEENPSSFRFTVGAAVMLGAQAPRRVESELWGRLVVQPNFDLVALAPVSETLLLGLDRFSDRVSLEHIAQYRLSKASVTRAIQQGWRAETILRVLENASNGDIPQNVRYSLNEWERQARRVELWPNMTLLEVDDESQLDTLFADERAQPFLGRRFSPSLAEVMPQHLMALQELLWEQDTLPALTPVPVDETLIAGTPGQREPQWRLHENGLLEPCHPVLDLYLVSEIRHFCEPDGASGWFKLTEFSLQQALAEGIELAAIVRFLQQYCEGGIPPALLIRLKLWGGGYDHLRALYVEQAPLLRLPESVLHDLQADDEIAPLLGDEVEQQARLVRVDVEKLAQVVALLRERGFLVE
jgi:hypothetical protein